MFGLIDGQQSHGQAPQNNSSLPYLQSESFEVSIGHGIARIKAIQHYLNFNENEQSHIEFYFPQSKNIVLESFQAELEKSKCCVESTISSNLADSVQCKRDNSKVSEKVIQNKFPNGIIVEEWIRFKLPVVKAQESISTIVVYSQKLKLTREGFYSLQLPQQISSASYPISTKIHFEERSSEKSIVYHSLNHEVTQFQQPVLLDNGGGLQPLSLRSNYSHNVDKPFIINFFNKDTTHISSILLQSSDICCQQPKIEGNYALITFVPSMLSGVSCSNKLAQSIEHNPSLNDCADSFVDCLKVSQSKTEIILILDRSGGMDGQRLSQATEGIALILKSLPSSSYFNVVSQGCGNKLESLFDHSVPYSQENLVSSLNRIRSFQANLGSSFNLLNSLKHIEGQKIIPHFARQIVVISDSAELENSLEDISAFLSNSKLASPIHTINANHGSESVAFNQLSTSTGGISACQNDNVLDSILNVLPLLLQPTLSNFEISVGAGANTISQYIPDIQKLKSIQFNEQISLVIAFKNNPSSSEKSIPVTFKFFNSASNKVEEHTLDLLHSQKQGSSHISKDFKKSLLKFCIYEHITSLQSSQSNLTKDLSIYFQLLANNQTCWVTKSYQISETGEEKKPIADQGQLSSIRESAININYHLQAQQIRKASGASNLMHLYDNQIGEDNISQSDSQQQNKSQDINNLIDAIFMGEPQKLPEHQPQEQNYQKKSGSISSHGQNTDLLDIGDDIQTTSSSIPVQGQMSVVSNIAQMGDPSSELNDDILDFIQSSPNMSSHQNNQVQGSGGNAIDLLDDFMIGDSPSQSQVKNATLFEILDNINFDGLFNANKLILHSILQCNTDKFIADKPQNLSLEQWSSLLVLASLKKNLSQDIKKWRIIAQKGREQLQNILLGDAFDQIYKQSEQYLK